MLKTAVRAALSAGAILKEGFMNLSAAQISLKGRGDYLTEIDERSEQEIIGIIKSVWPDHRIIAEESGAEPGGSSVSWIIDPLDGTANYVRGVPVFAVSIGIRSGGRLVAGVIYNPLLEEMFTACEGKGAFRNNKPIRVSDTTQLSSAMLATGFPWRYPDIIDDYTAGLANMMKQSGGIRRLGAAAVDLAYTACGIFDGFWERKLKPWDIAAGAVIIREAGGVVTDLDGGDDFLESGNIAAGNPAVHQSLLDQLRQDRS